MKEIGTVKGKVKAILFVGCLPSLTSEQDLIRYFSYYGEVTKVRIVKDKKTKISKGYAYVTMRHSRVVSTITSEEHWLDNRLIEV